MQFESKAFSSTPEILKRHTGAELARPITVDDSAFTNGVCKAGTPLDTDGKVFAVTGGTKGTWTLTISSAFASDETIVIGGVTYTCGETENKENKVFAGATAALQATSLVNIVEYAGFVLTNSSAVITFTQSVPNASGSAPVATTEATTGAIGDVTAGTSAVDGTPNAIGILWNDVYVENPNGSLLFADADINTSVAEAWSGIEYSPAMKSALAHLIFE